MKNSNIKIIFVDIDWTIFDHSDKPSVFDYESIEALKKVQEQGTKVFICSARPFHSIKQIDILDIFKPDGIICSNGGLIIYHDEIIFQTKVDPKEFEKLCELANKISANVEGIRPYDCFLINENYEFLFDLYKTYPEELPHIEDYHNQEVMGIGLFIDEKYDEMIKKELPYFKYYYRFHPSGVDVANEIHDKGESVRFVLNYLGIDKKYSASFGDDLQDITMFNETNYSVAMDNAKEEVKSAAKIITKSVTEHGVKFALENLL